MYRRTAMLGPDSFRAWEQLGMDREGQCMQALKQGRRRSVKKLVPDAENPPRKCRGSLLPTSFRNDLL